MCIYIFSLFQYQSCLYKSATLFLRYHEALFFTLVIFTLEIDLYYVKYIVCICMYITQFMFKTHTQRACIEYREISLFALRSYVACNIQFGKYISLLFLILYSNLFENTVNYSIVSS